MLVYLLPAVLTSPGSMSLVFVEAASRSSPFVPCRHASGCAGNFSHDPPREAGHDVQCHLEQRDPPSLPQVHARRKYPSTFSPSAPRPLPSPRPCPPPPDSLVLQVPRRGTIPSGSDDSLKRRTEAEIASVRFRAGARELPEDLVGLT